jgi:recombination protein RecT
MTTKKDNPESPAVKEKTIATKVLEQIQGFTATGEIQMPPNYSPENAIKGAWIVLQDVKDRNSKPVLEACTKASIASSLFKMCMEGLSALKGQGYFIAYGDQLTWIRDYNGSRALAKRVADVKDVPANVVFESDEFSYGVNPETGYQYLITHKPDPKGRDMDKIIGAYAIVVYNDGHSNLEYMTFAEINQAWKQGATKGQSPAHKNFPQEMAKKTVINRACKAPINSSDDGYLFSVNDEQIDIEDTTYENIDNETGTKAISFESNLDVSNGFDSVSIKNEVEEAPPYGTDQVTHLDMNKNK